jgi:hypothetical protein
LREVKKVNLSHKQEEQATALLTKYRGKKLTDLRSQKNLSWLFADQIIPSKHNFRNKVKENYEQDWRKIDLSKLYIQDCMESFQWRSAHGKLYARRDLVRFGYTQEANCTYSNTLQELRKTLQIRHRAILVQKNDRDRHKGTKEKGDAQEAGYPEEADLQLQP